MTEKSVTTGVSNASDTLPERADMPRIMDSHRWFITNGSETFGPYDTHKQAADAGSLWAYDERDDEPITITYGRPITRDGSQVTR